MLLGPGRRQLGHHQFQLANLAMLAHGPLWLEPLFMELVSVVSQEHGRPVLALLLACLVPREHGLLRLVSCLVRVVWPAILEPGRPSLPPLPPLNALMFVLCFLYEI